MIFHITKYQIQGLETHLGSIGAQAPNVINFSRKKEIYIPYLYYNIII